MKRSSSEAGSAVLLPPAASPRRASTWRFSSVADALRGTFRDRRTGDPTSCTGSGAELQRQGLVHDFALSYTASFESDAGRLVYCEHGNQFDPTNTVSDFDDPLDTPLGDHIVTDLVPRLPRGWSTEGGNQPDVDRVFPLTSIPEWLAGRMFHYLATRTLRWLFLPLLVLFAAHDVLAYAAGHRGGVLDGLVVNLAYDVGVLLVVFGVFVFAAGRLSGRMIRSSAHHLRDAEDLQHFTDGAVDEIRRRLERGDPLPLGERGRGRDLCLRLRPHPRPVTDALRPGGRSRQLRLLVEAAPADCGSLRRASCFLLPLRPDTRARLSHDGRSRG
jgi:hypothetical protein